MVQGFGNVGSIAALELYNAGVKIIAVSDHTGALHRPAGLDVPSLIAHTAQHGSLAGYSNELALDPDELLTLPCDVLVPAAVEQVIDAKVADHLRCRVLAEGANGPTTPDADLVLQRRRDEIFVIPDIICNAGGVVVSYFEWVQDLAQFFWGEDEVMRRQYQILDAAFDQHGRPRPARQRLQPHRRDGHRRRARPRREEHARAVSVRQSRHCEERDAHQPREARRSCAAEARSSVAR